MTLTTRGGVVSMPIGLFLMGVNGAAVNPPFGFLIPPVPPIFCPAGDWVLRLPIPALPGITMLSFRTISFDLNFTLPPLISNTVKL